MLGYDGAKLEPWAHLTADGSVANLEASWAARELKFLPAAIRCAFLDEDPKLHAAANIDIPLPGGATKKLVSLSSWELLNIRMDDILALPKRIAELLGPGATLNGESAVWSYILGQYSLNTAGLLRAYANYLDGFQQLPVILTPSTKHYSWPKAAAILGIGSGAGLIDIEVDARARMNIDALRKQLNHALEHRTPVLMTVAVMGSTEETAVDPLGDVLALREEFRKKGLEFVVHADAAWGGYFITPLRKDFDQPPVVFNQRDETLRTWDAYPFVDNDSGVHLNAHTKRHMKLMRECDSVTVDPHKCGYIQYPAGAVAYRNTEYKNLLTFGAPVIGAPGTEPTVGMYGVEGSRPGACAAGVFLSHAVIRPSASGYGKLLNRALLNTKLFYLHLLALTRPEDPFVVEPLAPLPDGVGREQAVALLHRVREAGVDGLTPAELEIFNELGPDQNIVDYTFNLRDAHGRVNNDLDAMNRLNQGIYDKLHVIPGEDVEKYDLMITQTQMSTGDYGGVFIDSYCNRLHVTIPSGAITLNVNRSVIMDPWSGVTPDGKGDFFDVIFDVLRNTVLEVISESTKKVAAAHV